MISNPDEYIEQYKNAGSDIITVHKEVCGHLDKTLSSIKSTGCKAGVSINPGTDISGLEYVLDKIDLILVQFYFMQEHNKLYPSKNPFTGASETQLKMFDKAVGNDTIRKAFEKDFMVEDIKRILKTGLDDYIIMKKQYHLYD